MSVHLHLQNLPRSASNLDIRNFFSGLLVPEGGVQIVGGPDGDAFVAFSNENDLLQAIMRDGQRLNGQSVKLKLASRGNMEEVIEKRKMQLAEAKRARSLERGYRDEYATPPPPRDVQYREGDYPRYSHHPNEQSGDPYNPHTNTRDDYFNPKSQPASYDPYHHNTGGRNSYMAENDRYEKPYSGDHHPNGSGHYQWNKDMQHQDNYKNRYPEQQNPHDDTQERVDRVLKDSMSGREFPHSDTHPPPGQYEREMSRDRELLPDIEGDLRQFIGLVKRKSAESKGVPPWIKPDRDRSSNDVPEERHLNPDLEKELSDLFPSDELKDDLVVSINQFGDDRIVHNVPEPERFSPDSCKVDEWGNLLDMTTGPQNKIDIRDERIEESLSLSEQPRGSPERSPPRVTHSPISGSSNNEKEKRHSQDSRHRDSHRHSRARSRESRHSGERHRRHDSPGKRHKASPERNSQSERASSPRRERRNTGSSESRSRHHRERRSLSPRRRPSHEAGGRSRSPLRRSPSPLAHKPNQESIRCATIHNIAATVTTRDLREFFRLCAIPEGGVKLRSGKDDLDALVAYVKFMHANDVDEAMRLNGVMLHGRKVTITPISEKHFDRSTVESKRRSRSRSRSRSPYRSKSGHRPPYPSNPAYEKYSAGPPPPFQAPPYPHDPWGPRPGSYPPGPPIGQPYPPYPGPFSGGYSGYYGHSGHPPMFFPPSVRIYPAYPPPAQDSYLPTAEPRERRKKEKGKGLMHTSMNSSNIDVMKKLSEQPVQPPKTEHKAKSKPVKPPPSNKNPPRKDSSSSQKDSSKISSTSVSSSSKTPYERKDGKPIKEKQMRFLKMSNLPPGIHAWEVRRLLGETAIPVDGVTLIRRSTGTAQCAFIQFDDMKQLDIVKEKAKRREVMVCSAHTLYNELHRLDPTCQVLRSAEGNKDEVLMEQMSSSASNGGPNSGRLGLDVSFDSISSSSFSDSLDETEEDTDSENIATDKAVKLPGIVVRVFNFPLTISEEEAEEFFSACKPIKMSTRKAWTSRGHVVIVVRFETKELANKAVAEMNNKLYQGKPVKVSVDKK